ncbi:MAG: hypothetical protein M3022_05715, partial [Actinomycetota bacterium]|nr:hypothetical protein [Actinomycetota bacterium]
MPAPSDPAGRVLILGEPGGLGQALVARLTHAGMVGTAIPARSGDDLTKVLSRPHWTSVAVLTHDD